MKVLRWLLPLLSLLAVLWFTWWDVQQGGTGPGPVHSAHGNVPAIAGGTHCESCHRQGAGVAADLCTKCHTAIAEQATGKTGLHGTLAAPLLGRCETCHSDHHGDTVPLIASFAFQRAGVADEKAYDHRHVPFTLTGAHTALVCTKCHPHAADPVPPAEGRYLGLVQRCTSCHDDTHRGAFGSDCARCHGQERAWREVPGFAHTSFPLLASHARVACGACHEAGTVFEVAAEQRAAQPVRACSVCHEDPHGGAGDAAKALQLPGAGDCARCHDATTWAAAVPTVERHAELGFALRGAHATATCGSCHGDAKQAPRWRGAAPERLACAVCHEHPHTPALVTTATAVVGPANGCADCHRDDHTRFAEGGISPAQHAASGFPLTIPHAEVACTKCHVGAERAERYPGRTPADCRGCHADVHAGQFAHDSRYAQCSACHDGAHFTPSTFGLAAHAASAWPLTGAHEAVACRACHQERVAATITFHGTKSRCADCHADAHRGAFDRPGRPTTVAGRSDCARCHDTQAFAPVVADFDHGIWTGYALEGAHRQVACAACHPAGAASTAPQVAGNTPPRLGKAAGTSCAACHTDPHAGQFQRGGTTDCKQCHEVASWQQLRFDHARDSRFPLDATHAKLACNQCHVGYPVGETSIVRYKPLGTHCGDCHQLGSQGEGKK